MLISSRNTLTDTPRNNVLPANGADKTLQGPQIFISNKFKADVDATGTGPQFENHCKRENFQTRIPGKNSCGLWKFLKIQGQESNLAHLETNSVTYSSVVSTTPSSGLPYMKTLFSCFCVSMTTVKV